VDAEERRWEIARLERQVEQDRDTIKRYEKIIEENENEIRNDGIKWVNAVSEPISVKNFITFLGGYSNKPERLRKNSQEYREIIQSLRRSIEVNLKQIRDLKRKN
jgi:hypothetical protein